MTEAHMLHEHGTKLVQLKAANIVQAARADLRLLERKRAKTADPDALYSFARRHVKRARSEAHLIALAYFEPWFAQTTDKKSTMVVYHDRELLRLTLIGILNETIEVAP